MNALAATNRNFKKANLFDEYVTWNLADESNRAKPELIHVQLVYSPLILTSYSPCFRRFEVVEARFLHSSFNALVDLATKIFEEEGGVLELLRRNFFKFCKENVFKVLRRVPPIPEGLLYEGKDFLPRCFCRNPAERPNASALLDHPLRSLHSCFAGIKLTDTTYNQKDSTRARTEPVMKGRHSPNPTVKSITRENENIVPASRLHSLFLRSNHFFPDISVSLMNPSSGCHPFEGKHSSSSRNEP